MLVAQIEALKGSIQSLFTRIGCSEKSVLVDAGTRMRLLICVLVLRWLVYAQVHVGDAVGFYSDREQHDAVLGRY
jgi:hypothetical protein